MDPLTALGLAANVLTFIDFTSKILKAGKTIYNEGTSEENKSREIVVADLEKLREKLRSFSRTTVNGQGPLTQDEQALETLSGECIKIASELHHVLSQLHLGADRTKLASVGQALRMAWKAGKITATVDRLNAIRDEIQFRLIVSIMSSMNDIESCIRTAKDDFDKATSEIVTAMLVNQDQLNLVVSQATDSMTQYIVDLDQSAQKRHLELMTAIDQIPRTAASVTPQMTFRAPVSSEVDAALRYALNFAEREDRLLDLDAKPHHLKTFEWIYEAHTSERPPWDDLGEWFEQGQGFYWISGKAGCGKSTLMRLLHRDRRTHPALLNWAAGSKLVQLRFFFWSLGTSSLHKSIRGLYQSLLYQSLSQRHELGPILFPDQYEPDASWQGFPTQSQLTQAIGRLFNSQMTGVKIFLLIDGLDEFEDARDPQQNMSKQEDLLTLLTTAVSHPDIKAVLSSRPYTLFEETFQGCPKLRLHELTRLDISLYVQDNLRQHPRMSTVLAQHPDEAEALLAEIVHSASGVFLWVKLVVRSLLEGLRVHEDISSDGLSTLRARLNELPKDLEDLFEHMLAKVHRRDLVISSEILQILQCYNNAAADLDDEIVPLTASILQFARRSCKTILAAPIEPEFALDIIAAQVGIDKHLRDKCAGLVELRVARSTDQSSHHGIGSRDTRLGSHSTDIMDPEVQFLHKSVADFLGRKDIKDAMKSRTQPSGFSAEMCLLRAMLMCLKSTASSAPFKLTSLSDARPRQTLGIWNYVGTAMYFAREGDPSTLFEQTQLLENIDEVVTRLFKKSHVKGRKCECMRRLGIRGDWYDLQPWVRLPDTCCHGTFLSLAIQCNLELYVRSKLSNLRGSTANNLQTIGIPWLHYACRYVARSPRDGWIISSGIIGDLLSMGCDPNEQFDHLTPWQPVLLSKNPPEQWLLALRLLILHGADVITPVVFAGHYEMERFLGPFDTPLFWLLYSFGLIYSRRGPPEFLSASRLSAPQKLLRDEIVALMIERGATLLTAGRNWREGFEVSAEAEAIYVSIQSREKSQADSSSPGKAASPAQKGRAESSHRSGLRRLLDKIRYGSQD